VKTIPPDMVHAHNLDGNAERAALINREILQLCVLLLVAVATFFLTRAVAASNRDMSLRDAAEWYRRGQQALQAGRFDEALEAFRRATVRNRTERTYVLALARTLAQHHDDDAARSVLLTLRESAPEDAEVNLELARVAARHDVAEALRFYHHALYAPWPVELAEERRRVRFELIRFLLAHNESGRALSELLAVTTDLRDEPAALVRAAQLFAETGDHLRAVEQFDRALRLAPDNGTALAGAGHSAFQLGKYALARNYLRRAPAGLKDVDAERTLVELVLSNDPLANRLGSAERLRRLLSDLHYARQRLATCLAGRAADQITDDERAFQHEAEALNSRLKPRSTPDQDTIEAGVDLVTRIEGHVVQACGRPTPFDRALVLIGRQYGFDQR
jgi:Tfp pilus assembly protein PilF